MVVRADLNDFWRLAVDAGWQLSKHCLFYPNPWPKSKHIQQPLHGGGVISIPTKLGGEIEVRSNWPIYIDEFATALNIAGIEAQSEEIPSGSTNHSFERKYWASGQKAACGCQFVNPTFRCLYSLSWHHSVAAEFSSLHTVVLSARPIRLSMLSPSLNSLTPKEAVILSIRWPLRRSFNGYLSEGFARGFGKLTRHN